MSLLPLEHCSHCRHRMHGRFWLFLMCPDCVRCLMNIEKLQRCCELMEEDIDLAGINFQQKIEISLVHLEEWFHKMDKSLPQFLFSWFYNNSRGGFPLPTGDDYSVRNEAETYLVYIIDAVRWFIWSNFFLNTGYTTFPASQTFNPFEQGWYWYFIDNVICLLCRASTASFNCSLV